MDNIEKSAVSLFFRAELVPPPEQQAPAVDAVETKHQEVSAYNQTGAGQPEAGGTTNTPDPAARRPQQREEPKVGRNDPCPCGSGQKYKKCCGRAG